MKSCKLAVLSYLFGFVSGLILLFLQKDNQLVRYSASQSIVFSILAIIVCLLLNSIPLIGWFFAVLVAFFAFLLWIFLIWRAYQNVYVRLLGISNLSEKLEKIL